MFDHKCLKRLESRELIHPHECLGLHGNEIYLWRPGATDVHLEVLGKIVLCSKTPFPGVFKYTCPKNISRREYRIYHLDGSLEYDPYAFFPEIGSLDLFLFNKGCHYELYNVLGAKKKTIDGIEGIQFSVWAPNALGVSLVADFNFFDGRTFPMFLHGSSGVWSIFIPGVKEGVKYKYEIKISESSRYIKSDPYAHFFELRPKNASVVADVHAMHWTDQEWLKRRKMQNLRGPMNVYEVHLGSWKKAGSSFLNYKFLAHELGQYCKEMHFTHVELMPVMEHPLDESWGYQVTGFFAPSSRFGSVSDFQYFVNHMHSLGLGVILDWVPAHFPVDDFALHRFDGTALYEHEDPNMGLHPHWNTAIFNYDRREVSNFLIASALFWFDIMHVDGLRVDAVASMLYLDYGREPGQWKPNSDGSNLNLHAIEFIKHLNSIVHKRFPGTLMIAEESSSFQGVTCFEGLGFDLKWNMGWMNDILRYVQIDPIYRKYHHQHLTFSMLYAFSEKFMLVLSHDEVVHLKKSLLSKMPGPDFQKFAGLRLLYAYMITHPGKKLLFMGGEIGQWGEWDCLSSLDWHVLDHPSNKGLQQMVRELNQLYIKRKALWENDFDWSGYEWVDFSDLDFSVISFLRKAKNEKSLLVILNFSPEFIHNYCLKVKNVKKTVEIFNSDARKYGGSGQENIEAKTCEHYITFRLSPMAAMIFEVEFE